LAQSATAPSAKPLWANIKTKRRSANATPSITGDEAKVNFVLKYNWRPETSGINGADSEKPYE
jgi:hypothetical protein